MRIKLETVMAHPTLGVANPGDIIDLPDEDAEVLIEAGQAEFAAEGERSPAAVDVKKVNEAKADIRATQMLRELMQTTDENGWLK
jgi:hypothetical protein